MESKGKVDRNNPKYKDITHPHWEKKIRTGPNMDKFVYGGRMKGNAEVRAQKVKKVHTWVTNGFHFFQEVGGYRMRVQEYLYNVPILEIGIITVIPALWLCNKRQ